MFLHALPSGIHSIGKVFDIGVDLFRGSLVPFETSLHSTGHQDGETCRDAGNLRSHKCHFLRLVESDQTRLRDNVGRPSSGVLVSE